MSNSGCPQGLVKGARLFLVSGDNQTGLPGARASSVREERRETRELDGLLGNLLIASFCRAGLETGVEYESFETLCWLLLRVGEPEGK